MSVTTEAWYHGVDTLMLIGADDFTLYSQPLVLDLYTMVSPCGAYGYCHSDHDPECTSTERRGLTTLQIRFQDEVNASMTNAVMTTVIVKKRT